MFTIKKRWLKYTLVLISTKNDICLQNIVSKVSFRGFENTFGNFSCHFRYASPTSLVSVVDWSYESAVVAWEIFISTKKIVYEVFEQEPDVFPKLGLY